MFRYISLYTSIPNMSKRRMIRVNGNITQTKRYGNFTMFVKLLIFCEIEFLNSFK